MSSTHLVKEEIVVYSLFLWFNLLNIFF